MNVDATTATWDTENVQQPVERLKLLKLIMLLLPFQLLIVPGLPLNVPVSLLLVFYAVVLHLARSKTIVWVGVEGALLLFIAFAILSICLALLTTREGIFHVLPESYGIRGSRFRGFYQICILVAWYLTAWIVVNTCLTKEALFRVLRFWLLCVIGVNLYGCYEVAADQFGLPMYYLATFEVNFARPHVLGLQRSYSVFGEPTTYASYLDMNLALAWGLRMHLPEDVRRYRLPVNTVFVHVVCGIVFHRVGGRVRCFRCDHVCHGNLYAKKFLSTRSSDACVAGCQYRSRYDRVGFRVG